MTTPNIEELRLLAQTLEFSDAVRCSIQRAADLLQVQQELLSSQAERINELEAVNKLLSGIQENTEEENRALCAQLADAELHNKQVERGLDKATAQLAAIRAQEPALVVEKEPDYWSGGHFHEGSKPHIKPTKVWCLPIGTKLFTRPMPAQGVTELVEALELAVKLNSFREFNDHIPAMRDALSKYKGAK